MRERKKGLHFKPFLCFMGGFYIRGWVNFCSGVLSPNCIGFCQIIQRHLMFMSADIMEQADRCTTKWLQRGKPMGAGLSDKTAGSIIKYCLFVSGVPQV